MKEGNIKFYRIFADTEAGISDDVIKDWLSSGYISIGGNHLGDISDIKNKKDCEKYENCSSQYMSYAAKFLEITKRDYVVVVQGGCVRGIGKVKNNYYLRRELIFGQCRDVEWICKFGKEKKKLPNCRMGQTTFALVRDEKNIAFLRKILDRYQ